METKDRMSLDIGAAVIAGLIGRELAIGIPARQLVERSEELTV
jgi:hypothetical protein